MNIDSDYKIDDLTFIKYLKSVDSPFLSKIQEVYDQVRDILNSRIQHVFPNFTLHNTGHSFRIMEYMSKLVSDYSKLNELEITILIYSALLHDIGMAVSEEDIAAIKSDSFSFCNVRFSSMKKITNGDEALALQEYVRRIHASLSGRYIRGNLSSKLVVPKLLSLDFTDDVAAICESHTNDYDWIKSNLRVNEVRGDYSYNPQFLAAILRLADILDIDGNRTPYNLYRLISPKGISDDEWKQHFIISNNDKIIVNETTRLKKIVFHGKATNASIHRKLLVYISWVKDELTSATALVSGMPPQYSLVYDTNPEVNIQTEGYTFSDYKMTLEFKAISSLLMGEKIYGNKTLGLRELIQNSMDSCRIRQETSCKNREFGEDIYQPKIKVVLDAPRNQAIVKDNGTGMSMEIIKRHFLNIGVSYYTSNDFLLDDFDYKPIGNFGIGFLSCFMLSKDVKVMTRYFKSKNKYLIELEKGNEWTSLTEKEDVTFEGTEVILNYADFMAVFDNSNKKVEDFLGQYFLTDGIEFELVDKSGKEIKQINNSIALPSIQDKGLLKIDLSNYLKDIEGCVYLKKSTDFIKKFEDIDFPGALYMYNEEDGLTEVSDTRYLQIDDYISGKEIKYLFIPLIETHNEDDFLNGMKFTGDDLDEVISKMDRELTWISVIFPGDRQSLLSDERISRSSNLFQNFGIEELEQIGHSRLCETKAYVKTITLFEGRKNDLYLPFEKVDRDTRLWYSRIEKRRDLFMRNVLIKDFRYNIPISASVFEVNTIIANISSRKFIPDISRNNVDDKASKLINYMVGKAIHVGASDVLDLSADEKSTLQGFIKTFYSDKTEYEK